MPVITGRSWYEEFYKTCEDSSVGSIPNVTYQPNEEPIYGASHQKIFRLTDRRSGKDVKLYGIIDGFSDGGRVAEFVAERLISEILPPDSTGPHVLNSNPSDSEIKALLTQSFRRVDSAYFSDCIGEMLARRCALQMYPGGSADIQQFNEQIKGFATAVIALIYDNKLFVANLGDSRAIFVKKGVDELKAIKVCNWHDPSDDDERKRLGELKLNPKEIGTPTRCFGDFFRKWGYKEVPSLRGALGEPILADPSVLGPIIIDSSSRYLILLNGGVVSSIMEQNERMNVNVQVASLVAKEFSGQFNLSVIARAVLDAIARDHQTAFSESSLPPGCNRRRDIFLLVSHLAQFATETAVQNSSTPVATLDSDVEENSSASTPLDDQGRVYPYVDFSAFYTHPLKDEVLRNIEAIKKRHTVNLVLSEVDEE